MPPRDHHRIPRAYLAQFTDADGFVWTYDARRAGPTCATPINTAVERDLYSFATKDGRSTALESFLGKVENLGMPPLRKLAAGVPLTADEEDSFAVFVAATRLRTDATRLAFARAYVASMQQLATIHLENDPKLSEDERRKLLEFLRDKSRYEIHFRKDASLAPLGILLDVANTIRGKSWTILDAPEGENFVTSDNPVTVRFPEDLKTKTSSLNLAHPAAEVTFPLTPTCLWYGHSRPELRPRGKVDKSQLRELNRVRAIQSGGEIYANRRSESLWRFAQKWTGQQTPPSPSDEPATVVKLQRANTLSRRDK